MAREVEEFVIGTLNGLEVMIQLLPKGMIEEVWKPGTSGSVKRRRRTDDWILFFGDNGITIPQDVFEFIKECGMAEKKEDDDDSNATT